MKQILVFCLWIIFTASAVIHAEGGDRLIKQVKIPGSSRIVVVAEGEFEPRSLGSYSLRVYAGSNPSFPYDDYITGTIRPRDGMVEDVKIFDLDQDGSLDIIVVIRSAGTGGYLSADAFALRDTCLRLLESISTMPKDTDLIAAIKAKLKDFDVSKETIDTNKSSYNDFD